VRRTQKCFTGHRWLKVVTGFGKLIDQGQQEGDLMCGGEVASIRVRIDRSYPQLRLRGVSEGGVKSDNVGDDQVENRQRIPTAKQAVSKNSDQEQ
jgi:hypothetical protein